MFRRRFAGLIAVLMSLTLVLGACGGGSQPAQPAQPAPSQSQAPPASPPAPAQPVVLKVAYQKSPIQDIWIEKMVDWGKQNNITVEPNAISYEVYVQKVSANLLAPKGEYDVIWQNDDWGQLWGPRIEPLPPDLANAFQPFDLEPFMVNGKATAAPMVLTAGVFFYRTDLIKPEEFPKTWDELVQVSKQLQAEGKVKWGFVAGMKYPHSWFSLLWSLWSNGGDVLLPVFERDNAALAKNGWKSGATQPEFKQMVEFWHDAINLHKIAPPGITGYTRNDADPLFLGGEAAITMQDSTVWGAFNDASKSKVAGKIGIASWPTGPKGQQRIGWADAWAWAVPTNAPQKEAAFRLIKGVTTDAAWVEEATKKTGGVPGLKAVGDKLQKEDPVFGKIVAATIGAPKRVHSAYYMPEWPEVHTALADYVIKALTGPKDGIDAQLKALDAEVGRIMKK